MTSLRDHPLIVLMLLATAAADLAWLLAEGATPDPQRWQTFMLWGGWAQWSALTLACLLGPGRLGARAAWWTLGAVLLAIAAPHYSPANGLIYVTLAGLQAAGLVAIVVGLRLAAATCRAVRRRQAGCGSAGLDSDAGIPATQPLQFPLKAWFGWTALLAVWANAASEVALTDLGEAPLLGFANLAGAPALALAATTRGRSEWARGAWLAGAAVLAVALGIYSTRWLYDGPWSGLVTSRLVLVNLSQVFYLSAWRLILCLQAQQVPRRGARSNTKKRAREMTRMEFPLGRVE